MAVVSLVLLGGATPAPPWAEQALQWVAARDRAAHRSVTELVRFESPDTVHVLCCNQRGPLRGREPLAEFLTMTFGHTVDEETAGRTYVDVSGVAVEYRFPADPTERPSGGGPPADPDELQVSQVASHGEVTRTVHAASQQFLESPVYDGRAWYGDDLRAARPLIDRYLAAASGPGAGVLEQVYAPDATLVDSLLGVRLTGRSAIASYASRQPGTHLRLESIPGGGGPAVYGHWSGYHSHLQAFVAYAADDGTGCPGGVAVQLQIERGRVVAERRYHDVASMRRCVGVAHLPDGWWTHAATPTPIQDEVTGAVAAAGRSVEVHNGNAAADELVRWAMTRFPAAHLLAPQVTFVAFREEAHQEQCSGGAWGMAFQPGASAKVYVCLTVESTATPFQRTVLLHELAHAWMWQNLDEATQSAFVGQMHLPGWDGSSIPWEKRGIEQAADVIAWGLTDDTLAGEEIATHSCAELAQAYRLLTQQDPERPPCPPVTRPG